MQEENELNSTERELEGALSRLRPQTTGIDPLEVAFLAGRRARSSELVRWRAGAGIASILAMALLWLNVSSHQRSTSIVIDSATPASSGSAYLALRDRVIRDGESAVALGSPAVHNDVYTIRGGPGVELR